MKKLFLNKISPFISQKLNIGLVVVGIILRLDHYLENRSLWLDETYVAIGIVSRSLQEIVRFIPIFARQPKSPLGFTLCEKYATIFFGNSEYALRLFPLICSIVSLILFYRLIKKWLPPRAIPLALGLFAFSDSLVYFAAEVKTYSTDLLMTLILFSYFDHLKETKYRPISLLIFGIFGFSVIWISNPSVFVLGSIALIFMGICVVEKQWGKLSLIAFNGLFWLTSFVSLYWISFQKMLDLKYITDIWITAFAPRPIWSWEFLVWIKDIFCEIFGRPLGFAFPYLGILLFLGGCFQTFRNNKRRFFLLVLPIALTFMAAVAQKYPFRGRLLLFCVPAFYILIAEGTFFFIKGKQIWSRILACVIIVLIFWHPVQKAGSNLVGRRRREDSRIVMEYLKKHYKSGDRIIMNTQAQLPFWYYSTQLGIYNKIPKTKAIIAKDGYFQGIDIARFHDTLIYWQGRPYSVYNRFVSYYDEKGYYRVTACTGRGYKIYDDAVLQGLLKEERVWVILIHYKEDFRDFIMDVINKNGQQKKALEKKLACIYLYDFSVERPTVNE